MKYLIPPLSDPLPQLVLHGCHACTKLKRSYWGLNHSGIQKSRVNIGDDKWINGLSRGGGRGPGVRATTVIHTLRAGIGRARAGVGDGGRRVRLIAGCDACGQRVSSI